MQENKLLFLPDFSVGAIGGVPFLAVYKGTSPELTLALAKILLAQVKESIEYLDAWIKLKEKEKI